MILRKDRLMRAFFVQQSDFVDRLTHALPTIEDIVRRDPFITRDHFLTEYSTVAQQFNLSRRQEKLAASLFDRYESDRQDIRTYRDLVIKDQPKNHNPLEEVKDNPNALRNLLIDCGVKGIDNEVKLNQCHLSTTIPSCIVIRIAGPRAKTLSALGLPQTYTGAAFFESASLYTKEEISKMDPTQQERIRLLRGKLCVVIDDQNRRNDINSSTNHEIRHYLFSLYNRDIVHKKVGEFAKEGIRDEIAAYYGSNTQPRIMIQRFLPSELPEELGRGELHLQDSPQAAEGLYQVMFELSRLKLSRYSDFLLISRLATTSGTLEILVQHLKAIPSPLAPSPFKIVTDLFGSTVDARTVMEAQENIVWFEKIVEKSLLMPVNSAEREDFLNDIVKRLTFHMRVAVINGLLTFEDHSVSIPFLLEQIERFKSIFTPMNIDAVGLDRIVENLQDSLQRDKKRKRALGRLG